MSDAVFPILPGLAWSVIRTPQWSTNPQKSKSGRRYAVGDRLYPTWKYHLPYEFLRGASDTEAATLIGFVNQRRGMLDDFLYRDPDDFLATQQVIGVGDGVTRTFGLSRALGGFVEPIFCADTITQVRINGTSIPNEAGAGPRFTVDASAPNATSVIIGSPPSPGEIVDATFTWYWRCSLLSDAIPFEQFMSGLWKADIEFETHAP